MFTLFLAFVMNSAQASNCPTGDLKACQDYLKAEHAKKEEAFKPKYDEVCNTNAKFSCVKVIVRGDIDEEMKFQIEKRGPKAALYTVEYDGDKYIYILTSKIQAK